MLIDDEPPFGLGIGFHGGAKVTDKIVLGAGVAHRGANDLSRGHLEVGDQGLRPMAHVFELLGFRFARRHRAGGMEPFQRLDAGFLVGADHMDPVLMEFSRLRIEPANCPHLLPEPRFVCHLVIQPVAGPVRTVSRVHRQLVTEGMDFALRRRRQPPRPDQVKIKGDIEQRLLELACSDSPQGRCHWTLQRLADAWVVLGLVDSVSLETVRQALKKTTLSLGSSKSGAFRPTRMPNWSGEWKTLFRPLYCLTTPSIPWSASMKRVSSCLARFGGYPRAAGLGWTMNTSAKAFATSC